MALKEDCQDCPEIRLLNQKIDLQNQEMKKDLEEIKDNFRWIKRFAISAVITFASSLAATIVTIIAKIK